RRCTFRSFTRRLVAPLLYRVAVNSVGAQVTRQLAVIGLVMLGWLAAAHPVLAQQTSDLPPGWVTPTPVGLFTEPTSMKKLITATDGLVGDAEGRDGPYAELGHMITGAGWISAGPGYRTHILQGRAVIDGSAAISWNLYRVAQGRFELPHLAHDRLAVGGQATYQDVLQVDYFGVGNTSSEANESAYRFNNSDLLAYATFRARPWLSVSARAGWIPQPPVSTATGLRHITIPNTIDHFS